MKLPFLIKQHRFSVNVSSNVIGFVFSLMIGIWFTPYLINHLGVESYGFYPLANSVTSYMSLITLALNGALGRYLAIDINKSSFESANRTFNTALFGSIVITIVSFPILIGFIFAVPYLFNIPSGEETVTQILFFFVMISFFVTTIESCFSIISWTKSRFDLRNAVIISSSIFRLFIVIFLFNITKPSIWIVGLGILLSSLFGLLGDIFIWRRLTPELVVSLRYFDRSRIRDLFNMGGWIVVNQIGALLFLETSLVVANLALGARVSGEYGSLILFSILLSGLTATVSSVLTPIILEKYALNDLSRITSLSTQAIRLLGISIGLPVGLICGFGKPILIIWLGESFGHLWYLLILMIFYLPINLAVTPLFSIQTTLNKVKIPGIVSLVMGVMNILIAMLFIKYLDWGAYGLAGAGAIVLTIKNAIFTPLYAAYIQKLPWYVYIKAIIPGFVISCFIFLLSWALSSIFVINSWFNLLSIIGITSLVCVIVIYLFIFQKSDKKLLYSLFPKFIS